MQPKTKFDFQIMEASHKLDAKPLSETKKKWAAHAMFWHNYTTYYNKKVCLECNHKFKAEPRKNKTITCPSCLKKLHYTRPDCSMSQGYFAIYETIDGLQVVRIFAIVKHLSKTNPSRIEYSEVVRRFIKPKGKHKIVSKKRTGGMFSHQDFDFYSEFELKADNSTASGLICTRAATFPQRKFIPELIRNGFDFDLFSKRGDNPIEAMTLILKDNFFEWLCKSSPDFAKHYFYSSPRTKDRLVKIKPQLKQLFKTGARVNPSDYIDYINLLEKFGKDINNPFYSCPPNFHEAHQALVIKAARIKAKEDERQRAIYNDLMTKEYQKKKQQYLNVTIQEGEFILTVPKTVNDFERAGKELFHCIYTNEYYKKDTLILFAYKGEQLIETAEIDPKKNTVIQCRGYDNQPTEHNATIVNIIQNNLPLNPKKYETANMAS